MKRDPIPFPPIENPEPKKLPRGLSPRHATDKETSAGRALIALVKLTYGKSQGRIWVRNCYEHTRYGIYVENMREYAKHKSACARAVRLRRLTRSHFAIYKPPFLVSEPVVNCLVEMPKKDFDKLWKTHLFVHPPSFQTARAARPESTPMLRLLEAHWKAARLQEKWTPDRIVRLCRLWELTPHELAEMIQWPCSKMDYHLNNPDIAKFCNLPGPVAVWFEFLENFRFGLSTFPSMPEAQPGQSTAA